MECGHNNLLISFLIGEQLGGPSSWPWAVLFSGALFYAGNSASLKNGQLASFSERIGSLIGQPMARSGSSLDIGQNYTFGLNKKQVNK